MCPWLKPSQKREEAKRKIKLGIDPIEQRREEAKQNEEIQELIEAKQRNTFRTIKLINARNV